MCVLFDTLLLGLCVLTHDFWARTYTVIFFVNLHVPFPLDDEDDEPIPPTPPPAARIPSDDEEEEEKEEEEEEKMEISQESEKTKESSSTPGGRRRKRKRVLKSKTSIDEDGCMGELEFCFWCLI